MKTISIFVAGAKNLQHLRLRLKAMANDLNNEFKQKGVNMAVNMLSYENFGDDQQTYNKFIAEEADMVIFLLEDRIGAKTEEEYRIAVKCHEQNGHPEHCVFLKEFDHRTDDIAHIEELMSSTSNKYYVNYSNPEDLLAKAKSRISELAMNKKKSLMPPVSGKKRVKYTAWSFLVLLIALFFAARFASGPLKTSYVYFDFEFPNSMIQNGVNDTFLEQQLLLTVQEEANAAQDKINYILNDTLPNNSDWTISFPKKIQSGRNNRLRKSLRKIMDCRDIKVGLHLIESGDVITNDLFVTDWDGKVQHYTSEIAHPKEGLFKENITAALRKDAAYVSLPFNPIVSVLYDYHFLSELLVYQMVSPWKNKVFTALDREVILSEFAQSGRPNAPIAYLLLGNYYECFALENSFDKNAMNKAIEYYSFLSENPTVCGFIKDKMDMLEANVTANSSEEMNMVEMLETQGRFKTGDCKQLIIIGNEETLLINSKRHFNATLYTFEKGADGHWESVFPPFVVHLGVNGFAAPGEKREGDLKTPTGYYGIPYAFGKKNDLNTKLDFVEITPQHVWVCDTTSSDYNKMVVDQDGSYLNNKANEKLFRNDFLYDYAIVTDYNMNPTIKGMGSAIFMHIERTENHQTAGCISMSKDELVKLIEWLDSSMKPHIFFCKQIA